MANSGSSGGDKLLFRLYFSQAHSPCIHGITLLMVNQLMVHSDLTVFSAICLCEWGYSLSSTTHFFFLFAQAHKKVCFLWTQSTRVVSNSASLWTVTCQAPLPWNSPGKHTGVSCHSLLQGIFVIQGLNSGFLNCRFFTDWVTREAHKAE